MVDVVEVKTKKQLKAFATFPLKIYKDCPYYVPCMRDDEMSILNPKKNFNLEECDCKCFLAYKDGEIVGRVAGIIHKAANKIYNNKSIRFSRLDATDDLEVFKALIDKVSEYGKSEGMEIIHGPWGFNDTDREGMLTEGYDKRSTFATAYSYPYYVENIRKLGFADESKWLERDFVIPKEPYEKIARVADKLQARYDLTDISLTLSMKEIVKKYGDEFFDTYNEAYSVLDEYVPVKGNLKKSILSSFATAINRRYINILVNKEGEVAGLAVLLPSLANALIKHKGKLFPIGFVDVLNAIKHPEELEMALIAVKGQYKNSGINAVLMTKIMYNVMEDGILKVESNPMLENNYKIQANFQFAENSVVKRRQSFIKHI